MAFVGGFQFVTRGSANNIGCLYPIQKRNPGTSKYVCSYCGRACAKPSVLQKHIRSHTGERPYPCAPCGFSFKTKSNLYKHRKSHTHRSEDESRPPDPDEEVEEPDTISTQTLVPSRSSEIIPLCSTKCSTLTSL
uniref:C2H2-type domain-containing protein n=1 Tax=Gouania willdenowi TaxID=441366 RepID=A0A8C5EY31_GOUWI